jgi:hypothetical protein
VPERAEYPSPPGRFQWAGPKTLPMMRALRKILVLASLALMLDPGVAGGSARPPSVVEDPFFQAQLEEGLERLYNLELAEAELRFRRLALRYPGHPAGPLLLILGDWWRMLLDVEDRSRDARIQAAIAETLQRADRRLARDAKDLDGRFMKATALALRARLRSLRGEWLAAAQDSRRALGLVRDIHQELPDNYDLYFGLGLYDYFSVAIPERYAALRPLRPLFPPGDRDQGLRRLRIASQMGQLSRVEAGYFLVQIYYHFEEDYERSLQHTRWLRQRYPGNALFHTMEGRIQSRWGRCRQAVPILEDVVALHRRGQEGYTASQAEQALYYLSRCEMRDGGYARALTHLEELERIAGPRGSSYRVLVHLQRGMTYDVQQRRGAAIAEYRQALRLPDSAQAHDRARQYLRNPFTR